MKFVFGELCRRGGCYMKKIRSLAVVVLLMLAMITPNALPVTENVGVVEAATIKISSKRLTLKIGKRKVLKISGTNKKVTWKSNKKSVATVSSIGKVTARAAGKAHITATVGKKKYTCIVTVPAIKKVTDSKLKGIIKLVPPKDNVTPPSKSITTINGLNKRILSINNNCPEGEYEIRLSGFSVKNHLSKIKKAVYNNNTTFGKIQSFLYYYSGDVIFKIVVQVEKTYQYEMARAFADEGYLDKTTNTTVKDIYPVVKKIIKENIKSDMTDYEKEKAIHDYMIKTYSYDTSYSMFNVEELLLKKKGVCQAYADTFQLLLDLVGIECLTQVGIANGGGHAWNIVKLDGEWYNVDVTWDDPISNVDILRYDYFNITDKQLSQDHKWEPQKGISATATKYRYK